MFNLKFNNLIIKNLEELKSVYIFINEKCYIILNYNNYNEDFKLDIVNNNVLIYFKNKLVLKYNKNNDNFKLYK